MNRRLIKIMLSVVFSSFTHSSDWDGWMTCCVTTFSTEFQPYQDDEWVIMKSCLQWNPFTIDMIFSSGRVSPNTLDY